MSQRRSDLWVVISFAGLCGVYFGLTMPWQIAVETAQVLAGIVTYPVDNPFYMYHVKSWTLLHQIPALLLSAGISERAVSYLISCTAAVLSFESLALTTLTFSRNRFVACGVPLVCLATKCFQDCGAVYPIHMLPDVYWTTYGVTGTYYVLFVWSLFGVGLRGPAAFLCGLAPAVHPALGTWCIATVASAVIWRWWEKRAILSFDSRTGQGTATGSGRLTHSLQFAICAGCRRHISGQFAILFALGLLITIISFAIQQYLSRDVASADPVLARQMLEAFVNGWDNHRSPVPLEHVQWHIGWCTLLLAAVALAWHACDFSLDEALMLRIVVITAIAGLAMCWLTWCTDWLPLTVVMAMPGRFLNFAVVLCPALVLGLTWRLRSTWTVAALFASLMIYSVLRTTTVRMELFYVPAVAKVLIIAGLALVHLQSRRLNRSRFGSLVRGVTLLCLGLLALLWRHDWRLAAIGWMTLAVLLILRDSALAPWPRALERWLAFLAIACPLAAVGIQTGPWLAIGLTAGLLALIFRERCSSLTNSRAGTWREVYRQWLSPQNRAALVCGALCVVLVGSQAIGQLKAKRNRFNDWRNDPVFAAAGRSEGLLLTSPRMGIVQLRSRRGILMNSEAMNQLTYVPGSGPAMNRMLNEIYGDDLLAPRPAGWIKAGGLMRYSAYDLWQNRTAVEWQRLAKEFGFRHILTYPDWKLDLPLAVSSREYLLYEVPDVDPARDDQIASERPSPHF